MALGILYCINTKGDAFRRKVSCLSRTRVFRWNWETGGYCEENIEQHKEEEDISCGVFTYYFYYVFWYPRFMTPLLSNLHACYATYCLMFIYLMVFFEFMSKVFVYDVRHLDS